MVRLTTKTLEGILEAARELLQDSIVSEVYELTYQGAVTNYELPGFSPNDARVLSIEAIEGINLAGNYITEEDLTEGVDYDLYLQEGTVEDGYGAASGEPFYAGITISALTFKDNSTVYIRYKYQSPDFRPILTNFAGNSQLLMFLATVFSNVQQDLTTLAATIEAFGIDATGENLERIGSIFDVDKTDAVATTGQVRVTNNDASATFTITSSTRFIARAGSSIIAFQSVTGSGSVAPQTTANIAVVAVVAGKQGNVGPYSITEVYEDTALTVQAPSYVVVTNPPQVAGSDNFFDNGTDEEDDDPYRSRIQRDAQSAKTSSFATVEKAAFDTGFLSDVKAFDINTRKGISNNSNVIVLQTPTGNILSPTAVTTIRDAVLAVIGTGQTFRFEQTMASYLSISMDVFVDASTLEDTSLLQTQLENTVINHVNSKEIGSDVYPSTILALIISNVLVKDANITNLKVTEYVSDVNNHDIEVELSNASGVAQNEFMLALEFNSLVFTEVDAYDGANAFFDVTNTPIDERIAPTVKFAVLDYNNEYRASPLNIFNYFNSVTNSSTRINYDTTPAGQDPIVNGQDLIFDYNQYDNGLIDGVRVWLNGVDGEQVDVELRVGASPDTATLVHADTQKTITLDGGGLPKLYEVKFTTQQVLTPATSVYWLHVKSNSGNTGLTKLPLDSTNSDVPMNPELHVDGQFETSPAAPDGTFERLFDRATYHSYTEFTGGNVYNKVVVPTKSRYAESARVLESLFTFKEFIEE